MSHPRRLMCAAVAAFGLLALAGCTGGGADSGSAAQAGQSVADACAVVDDGMADLQSQISNPSGALATGDVAAVAELMDSMHSTFQELAPDVTNAEVSAIVTDMTEGLGTFSSSLEGVTDLSTLAADQELTAAVQQIQTAGSEFAELCGS